MPSVKEKHDAPEWKLKLMEVDASVAKRNISEKHNENRYYKDDEVGFIHQKNKSCIRIEDDGDINLFSSDILGLKIDKESESIKAFSSTTSLISESVNIYTSPMGFSWNGYYLNPTLYSKIGKGIPREDRDIRLRATFRRWDSEEERYRNIHTNIPLYLRKRTKTIYNEDINELLKDINISL